jgi:hypothetical protein
VKPAWNGQQMTPVKQATWLRSTALLVVVFIVCAGVPVRGAAQESADYELTEGTGTQFGLGAASFFMTIPYGLAKVVYATLGGIIGGFTYVLTAGNDRAAKSVWHTSLRGTYVITPEHLRGEKAVRFLGVPPEDAMSSEPMGEPPTSEPTK